MKKIISFICVLVLSLTAVFSLSCNAPAQKITLYAPDGAPALSIARLISDKSLDSQLDINIVTANEISTYVSGQQGVADICILPVNAASKLLGTKGEYQLLGSVTQGNLFLMKKANGENITPDNLQNLIGKKVGVINLANVPGLTFKAILNQKGIPFTTLAQGEANAFSVNLVALASGQEVLPSSDCDYFVVPEPAATTKQTATNGKLSICGSLQALYGDGNGYPQAVLVAKKSVISSNGDLIDKLISSFIQNKAWLLDDNTKPQDIISAVVSAFVDSDTAPTFTANNLNKTVINNCAINFIKASDCKNDVLEYLQSINAVSNNAFGAPNDEFFYVK